MFQWKIEEKLHVRRHFPGQQSEPPFTTTMKNECIKQMQNKQLIGDAESVVEHRPERTSCTRLTMIHQLYIRSASNWLYCL